MSNLIKVRKSFLYFICLQLWIMFIFLRYFKTQFSLSNEKYITVKYSIINELIKVIGQLRTNMNIIIGKIKIKNIIKLINQYWSILIVLLNMSTKDKIKQILSEVDKYRSKTKIQCIELDSYLYYQHIKITNNDSFFISCGMCSKPRTDVNPSFKRAFKTLNDLEKAEFYLMNVKHTDKILRSDYLNASKSLSQTSSHRKIQLKQPKKFKITLKSSNIYRGWTNLNVELLQNQKIIRINDSKIEIDLHYYLLRKSKNRSRSGIVLQSTQTGPLGNTIRICSSGLDCEQIFDIIHGLWEQSQYEFIESMLAQDIKKRKRKTETQKLLRPQSMMKDQGSTSQKSIIRTAYSIQKGLPKLQRRQSKCLSYALQIIPTFTSFINFNQISNGQYHEKNGLKVRKIIQFNKNGLHVEHFQKIIEDINHIKKRKQTISSIKILEQDKELEIQLIKQFDFFGEEDVLFLYEKHTFIHYGVIYIIEKSIDNQQQYGPKLQSIVQANIHHCIWRIRQKCDIIQLFVQAKISYSKDSKNWKKAQKYTSLFIGEMQKFFDGTTICKQGRQSIQNKQDSILSADFNQQLISQISEEQEQNFFTMPGSLIQEIQPINFQKNHSKLSISQVDINQSQQQSEYNNDNLLNHKHLIDPEPKGDKLLATSNKGHWLWQDEWEIRQNGDLVNVNQQKINAQSSVLKLVIKRIGKNILTGKSILSMSLPIQIFGIDSNLERLAKGYMFAPIFLQKAAASNDVVDRMKNVICFGLGFTLAYIRMEKPFNPILGQTYQGLIDGCPVYGEQISHHPPISSLLMMGRGYRIVGSFQAKVQMGMNSASGINEGFNHIQFQSDKNILKITSPPGQISGLVYGERKLSLIKKTYCLDEANSLMCEISWGKNKSSNDEFAKFNDYFCGKIIKLKPGVEMNNYKNIKQSQIQKEYGRVYGRFTQKIMFNDEILFDVQQESPYLVQDYIPCLQSDVRFRKDVIYRKQNNFALAQEAKEQLEEIQRRDRKLRANNHH